MTKQSPFRKISSTLVKFGAILLSCSFGAMAAFLMDNNAYDKASAELVALFSLLMAGVLPTAVLAATILRSGGLSVSRINQYRFALIKQVRLWAGLFFIAFFCDFFAYHWQEHRLENRYTRFRYTNLERIPAHKSNAFGEFSHNFLRLSASIAHVHHISWH